jgi:hypothetical protein
LMKPRESNPDILDSLDTAGDALRVTLTTLVRLEAALSQIEKSLAIDELPSASGFIQGTSDGVICVSGGLSPGNPLSQAIRSIRGLGKRLPSFVLGNDSGEDEESCQDILRVIRRSIGRPHYVFTLRVMDTLGPARLASQVIIGTRYLHGDEDALQRLEDGIEKIGAEPIRDDGEFGGGALVYTLVEAFSRESEPIVELTLSPGLVDDSQRFSELLSLLSQF